MNLPKPIPSYFVDRGLDHFSPTQANTPLDIWVFKYLHCDPKKRKDFKISSKMRCGTLVGDGIACHLSNKVLPMKHYDDFKRWNDEKDKAQWNNDKNFIDATMFQILDAMDKLNIKNEKMVFEYPVSLEDDRLDIPIIGRTDVQTPKLLIEIKTKWSIKAGKQKKDGTFSYYFPKLNDKFPDDTHLQQAAFYYIATKIPTVIIQASAKEYVIHKVDEHDYKKAYNDLVTNLTKKQEAAKLDHPEKVIQPDFSHTFWNIGDTYINEAKELYGY
tara:strand:+ start:508 stop:1323 length:816 start_codon:yes stop_codon:yes gene_type:complete